MKFIFVFILYALSLFASILDTGLVIVDNKSVTIPNGADFYSYIDKLGDNNLSVAYRKIAEPVDRLNNPYKNMSDVDTYEQAFANLRYFYTRLYDSNSTHFTDNKNLVLQAKKDVIIAELLAANRKKLSDETIVAMLIEYSSISRQMEILDINKDLMYKVAVEIVKKVLNGNCEFQVSKQDLQVELQSYESQKLYTTNKMQSVISANKILELQYNIAFINTIEGLQQIYNSKSWVDVGVLTFSSPKGLPVIDGNISDEIYKVGLKSLQDTIYEAKQNDEITAIIFNGYNKNYYHMKFDMLSNEFLHYWNTLKDYTLFVFVNNNVQVDDIFGFIDVIIKALIIQFVLIWLIKNKLKSGSGSLAIFVIRGSVLAYLVYYFAAQVLGLNSTSLAIFASTFSIAIGFGMQSLIQNFVSGVIILGDKTVKNGDYITIAGGQSGVVENITYRTTTIRTQDNTVLMIPNSKIFLETVENKTKFDPSVKLKALFLVEKDSNLVEIEKIFVNASEKIPGLIPAFIPELVIDSITKDGIMIEYRFLVSDIKYADAQRATRILYDAMRDAIGQKTESNLVATTTAATS